VVSFFFYGIAIYAAVGIKAAFVLPAVCVLIFLLATEPKRRKPWLNAIIDRETENSINRQYEMINVNPAKAAKFGVASGGLWILAAAVFITLSVVFGWQYAWLVFLFALAAQVFMTVSIF